ncbi:MAG: cobalt ECF transporter T component CbiQ [Eubacteriales bacterium]|jgi:cobalt/nickel transport system permease protein
MLIIDQLSYSSGMRRWNAEWKTVFALLTLVICIATRSVVTGMMTLAVMGTLTIRVGGVSFSRYTRLMAIPLGFLLVSVLVVLFSLSPQPLSAVALPVGNWFITASPSSFLRAAQLFWTALAGVSCLYFLSLSTPITDLLLVLRRAHCPELMLELMLLIYRYVFVLLEVAAGIAIAQQARLGNRNFTTSCRSAGQLFSVLLVRAFQRAGKLFDAMESRLYDGSIRVLTQRYPVRGWQIGLAVGVDAALLLVYAILRMRGILW